MEITELKVDDYHKVIKGYDHTSGMRAIIAVHNTNRGPAVGGTRLFPYGSDDEALHDVLRLSRGMTYKSALADIAFGGGKSVIIADPAQKTEELFKSFGRFVDSLEGVYICAEDVNTSPADMAVVRQETKNVLGLDGASGDPSPLTALGVLTSIRTTVEQLGLKMDGLSVTIQGIGHVGKILTELLRAEGVTVYIADLREQAVDDLAKKTGAIAIPAEKAVQNPCDVFAPCAMGAVLNEETIPTLNCKAVVGAANNQLAAPEDARRLADRGILYAPDYLVNAGGIINVSFEHQQDEYDAEGARQKVLGIGQTLKEIYDLAKKEDILPVEAADRIAEGRFKEAE